MYSFSIKLTKTKPTISPKKQKTCHTQIYNYDADQSSTNKCGTTYKWEKNTDEMLYLVNLSKSSYVKSVTSLGIQMKQPNQQ